MRQEHPGKKLMENYCYTCHNPTAPMSDGRIGPPMAGVKAHYLMKYPDKEDFTDHIVAFVEEPSMEKSEMQGAIKKFGLMPYQQFPDGAVEKIAEYIYEYEIKEPEWFAEHWKEGPGKGKYQQQGRTPGKGMGKGMGKEQKGMGKGMGMQRQNGAEKGLEIALGTRKVLGQNLMGAIQTKGTIHALEFCSTQALSLTDSMAQKNNATVQRVSDKPRNPANTANAEEAALVDFFTAQVSAGKDPQPILIPQNGSTRFYYPIVTNSMCLQCHGKPADMEPQVKEKILKLYPQDKAVGYSENEVRGIWKIEFENRR
jgi:cytochrome c553